MRLLLIEDDNDLYRALRRCLSQEGYDCDVCESGADAEYYLTNGGYNAVVLDRLLPGKDGLTILREMARAGRSDAGSDADGARYREGRTDGLDTGADDYLVKPFAMPELLSRIRALVRRPPTYRENESLRFGDLLLGRTRVQADLRQDGPDAFPQGDGRAGAFF
jgi:DNA-binding response OmpR family regulator